MKIFKRISIAFLMLCSLSSLTYAGGVSSSEVYKQFQGATDRYRPYVRWWWNGDKVEAQELVRQLHLLKEAGIAGVEINPISFPGREPLAVGHKSLDWLSDEWIDMLKVVFDEAKRLDMTCDLLVGSGWPFGAETLPRDERAEVMLTYAQPVESGRLFEMSTFHIFKEIDPGVSLVNTRRVPHLEKALLVPDPISDLSQAIDVTDKFVDDVLAVDVPAEGKWMFYAMVRYESFACVINGAPGAAGSILNHMDAVAVRKYLDRMDAAIEAKLGPLSGHLRSFFVDSMELEGNNWGPDFAAEFKKRRGYDIMPWLPFTMFKVGRLGSVLDYNFGVKKEGEFAEQVNRARFDFELTKAELYHERFTAVYADWCRDNGVKSRMQGYGRGFFPLETSLLLDIPEGESWTTNYLRHRLGEEMGDEDYRRGRGYLMIDKYVSSAAHLQGKRLVSSEEMTNTYKVFTTSLEFLKMGSDMAAFSGITHSVWHGFNYSPQDAPYPGWIQYGSYYNENNTWWPYFKYLNDYRARMCSILQNVDMYTDMCILPANYDLWAELGVQTDPFPEKLNVPYTSLIWEAIHKCGGGADYVTEIVLKDAVIRNGKICYGPKQYGVIFLPEVKSVSPELIAKLTEFVKTGGRVFCVGCAPSKSLGLHNYEERDAQIADMMAELEKSSNFVVLDKPEDGRYLEWYQDVMAQYNLPHAISIETPDRYLLQNRYIGDDKSEYYFFSNVNLTKTVESDIVFPRSVTSGKNAWIYDPSTGQRYRIKLDGGRFHLKLGPVETYFIVFNKEKGGQMWSPLPTSGAASRELLGWDLSLHHTHLDWVKEDKMQSLVDLKDTEWKNFMGDVTYKTTIKLNAANMPRYINLGKVAEIAELTVNGVNCGVSWFGNRVFDLKDVLHEGENTIEVKVTTLMGNYITTLPDEPNPAAKRFLHRRNQPLVPSGLIGPVMLYR